MGEIVRKECFLVQEAPTITMDGDRICVGYSGTIWRWNPIEFMAFCARGYETAANWLDECEPVESVN